METFVKIFILIVLLIVATPIVIYLYNIIKCAITNDCFSDREEWDFDE